MLIFNDRLRQIVDTQNELIKIYGGITDYHGIKVVWPKLAKWRNNDWYTSIQELYEAAAMAPGIITNNECDLFADLIYVLDIHEQQGKEYTFNKHNNTARRKNSGLGWKGVMASRELINRLEGVKQVNDYDAAVAYCRKLYNNPDFK